jgi:hypothetical protein
MRNSRLDDRQTALLADIRFFFTLRETEAELNKRWQRRGAFNADCI